MPTLLWRSTRDSDIAGSGAEEGTARTACGGGRFSAPLTVAWGSGMLEDARQAEALAHLHCDTWPLVLWSPAMRLSPETREES